MSRELFDFDSHDTAYHPDKAKKNEIWVNIGTESGVNAQLTMGVGEEIKVDGYDNVYNDYVAFDMDTIEDIDKVITMLINAKEMVKEYWEELGLPPPNIE